MIKTINLQKIFKTEEVETWALGYWTIRQEGNITSMEQKFPSTQSHSVPAFVKE